MILITGAKGQLGSDIVLEMNQRGIDCTGIDVTELDITDKQAVHSYLHILKPNCVIHCAAYTAVDAAEDNEELCMRVNKSGTENIAIACCETNAEMLYISTDYVFNGEGITPYETDTPTEPLQVYGKSKLAGEEAIQRNMDKFCIIRTSWVFGTNGNNFVKTMLQLAKIRDEINVVNDQIGSPTYTPDLAVLLCDMALSQKYGIYHATNEGYCSWAEFAQEIMLISGNSCRIKPIPTEQYVTLAVRPKNSRMSKASLDKAGFSRLPGWKDALERFMKQ